MNRQFREKFLVGEVTWEEERSCAGERWTQEQELDGRGQQRQMILTTGGPSQQVCSVREVLGRSPKEDQAFLPGCK